MLPVVVLTVFVVVDPLATDPQAAEVLLNKLATFHVSVPAEYIATPPALPS